MMIIDQQDSPIPCDGQVLLWACRLVLLLSVGASRRTLERTFVAETGLTIGAWRQRQRLLRALELLAQGEPVTTVALTVGYRTPSAFTAMFHEQLGTTPTRYFRPDP